MSGDAVVVGTVGCNRFATVRRPSESANTFSVPTRKLAQNIYIKTGFV